jgi:hypothetical protein
MAHCPHWLRKRMRDVRPLDLMRKHAAAPAVRWLCHVGECSHYMYFPPVTLMPFCAEAVVWQASLLLPAAAWPLPKGTCGAVHTAIAEGNLWCYPF